MEKDLPTRVLDWQKRAVEFALDEIVFRLRRLGYSAERRGMKVFGGSLRVEGVYRNPFILERDLEEAGWVVVTPSQRGDECSETMPLAEVIEYISLRNR